MVSRLVARSQLDAVRKVVGDGSRLTPVGCGPVGRDGRFSGGLYRISDLTPDEDRQVRDTAGDLLDAEARVSVPVQGEPSVFGEPMDYHGRGGALPTLATLRERRGQPSTNGSGEGVLVGMVDTGVQPHPWLAGGYLSASDDFEPDPLDPPAGAKVRSAGAQIQIGHGTFVAGLILQQAPAAGVWVERALATNGEGPVDRVAEAAKQLAARGVHVLNLSLSCRAEEVEAREAMKDLVADLIAINKDLVIVAAAGNLRDEREAPEPFWPAAVGAQQVVAVGAVNGPGDRTWAKYSNRGPWIDFAAPGTDLLSTYVVGVLRPSVTKPEQQYNGWAMWSGTSFSTAIVSGAIARLMTDQGRITPALEAVDRLRQGEFSSGTTDADKAAPSVPVVELVTWDAQEEARHHASAQKPTAQEKVGDDATAQG